MHTGGKRQTGFIWGNQCSLGQILPTRLRHSCFSSCTKPSQHSSALRYSFAQVEPSSLTHTNERWAAAVSQAAWLWNSWVTRSTDITAGQISRYMNLELPTTEILCSKFLTSSSGTIIVFATISSHLFLISLVESTSSNQTGPATGIVSLLHLQYFS